MPYNPAGLFSLVASYFANPGTTIRTEQHNPPLEDIASALSSVLIRDGRAPMTGPLNMNGFAISNVATGNTPGSVATLAQAMPIGAVIDFTGYTAPAGWMLCYGQAISRSTYAALFAIIGTNFGSGDGSTTFNLPDLRGRVVAGLNNMGGVVSGRLGSGAGFSVSGANPNVIGAAAGVEAPVLTLGQLPTGINSRNVNQPITVSTSQPVIYGAFYTSTTNGGGAGFSYWTTGTSGFLQSAGSADVEVTSNNTGGQAHNNVQPTMVLTKIIKVSYDG